MKDVATGQLRPGDWIAGKYQVERVLGAGGMGVVVAARHAALRQTVAVKLLLPSAMRFPDAPARFLREAQAAVAIRSEHVARVLDVGTLDTGAPYMVMEYLAGKDLRALARERGPLPLDEAVDFVLQSGEALAEAHSLGIVHRDLKPANIFLTTRADGSPLVKVLDFGLSKVTGSGPEQERGLTATDVVAGSPEYMSPEQVRSLKDVDGRTDIWALGVALYELLTGHRPFHGPTAAAVCASVAADTPAPVRSLRPDLPEGIAKVIEGCLVKDRNRRTSTMGELAAALAPFAPPESSPSIERIARMSAGSRASLPDAGTARAPGRATAPITSAPPGTASDQVPAPPHLAASSGDGFVAASAIGSSGPSGAHVSPARQDGTVPLSHAGQGGSGHTDGWGQTRPSHVPSRRGPMMAVLGATGAVVITVGVILWQVLGASGPSVSGAEGGRSSEPSARVEVPARSDPGRTITILPVEPLPSTAPSTSASTLASAASDSPVPSGASAGTSAPAATTGAATTPRPSTAKPGVQKPPPAKTAGAILDTPL